MSNHARTPPPRPLGAKETLETLTHWKTTFRTFYKRDDTYKYFIKEQTKWDPSDEAYYGQVDEDAASTLKRKKADMKEDLVDLLNTLAGYLPHSYLTDKILKSTKGWKDVWNVIHDHYGVQVTSESLLDFESLQKQTGETHRQFFERLLQHARQHLAPADVKVEQIRNASADKMTISMMNMVALQWLRKTNVALIDIVRTEYSTELRSNTQLAELVPRIALNVDSLLCRYNKGANTHKVEAIEEDNETVDNVTVNRTWGRGNSFQPRDGKSRGQQARGGSTRGRSSAGRGNQAQSARGAGPFCPGCYFLSQQLGTSIHFRHVPGDCPRKAITVKMLQMEDNEHFQDADDDIASVGKIQSSQEINEKELNQLQAQMTSKQGSPVTMNINVNLSSATPANVPLCNHNTANIDDNVDVKNIHISDMTGKTEENQMSTLVAAIHRLEERKLMWNKTGVRKEKSPMVSIILNSKLSMATVDEGSEINCMDETFAMKNNIKFVPTSCKAMAAGSNSMKLGGQTLQDIKLEVQGARSPITWDLGKMVVVSNLGVDLLVGEPGKVDNRIITIPHKRIIEVKDVNDKTIRLPYSPKVSTSACYFTPCRATKSETIYPGSCTTYHLPMELRTARYVNIAPRRESPFPWIKSMNVKVDAPGTIAIENKTNFPVKILKNEHFADIRSCQEVSIGNLEGDFTVEAKENVKKIYDTNLNDNSHLIPHTSDVVGSEQSFLKEIIIDPDDQLSPRWKQRFKSVCESYSDIINPRPGKYNGFYGRIDNSINFSATPPPTVRAHLPNYSHDMLQILAAKMDKLEEWGVLMKPEEIGVVPEFIVPSMLMPKAEKGEWRLVTDFTPLNIHIKKLETVSPTIQEAKAKLAKYKFHIQLDLSNYFYQSGMKIEDCQFLATPHPFKGLRVYVCEPQGLKNASEHAYEKLARIYGDLCGEEKMTRMADGLFILGETLEDLEDNFKEVLARARLCGLTFKPSKVNIAPLNTVLFGWKKVGDGWKPTSHTVCPLSKADPPTTVKQLRSWLGSFKQLTECVPSYATLLGPLEDVVGGRASAERINWTPNLKESFDKAKQSLNNINTVFVPKPTDTLHTYSDYSAANKAVGGRLEIHRTDPNGSVLKLLGGHYSCRVSKHQRQWYPCEGEALATKLVIKNFSGYLRESQNKVIHHTDNMPTVQAWKRSKTGAFSTSARISTFLSGISALDIELIYTPGKEMKSSDYNSRHPTTCNEKRCQICKFAAEMEQMGDNVVPMVAKISVEDIEQGRIGMPFTQRAAWLKVQKNDKMHQQLSWLIDSSQSPEKKKTKGDYTNLKRLHNQFKNGGLTKAKDGLITITHVDADGVSSQAISVPSSMYPGLIQALHLKLSHPSKAQMQKLSSRYFYSPGFARVIEEITDYCVVCAALKQLPKELFSESTTEVTAFGTMFSADVILREGQKIFLSREKLSQFTTTCFVNDQTADSLREALISSIIELIPESGAVVQVDCATALQTLSTESESNGSLLKKLGIKVDLGRSLNKNKNPVAENTIKEFHKECLRLNPSGGPISEIDRALVTRNMNSRLRNRGFSSKEIAFQRDQITNQVKHIADEKMSETQFQQRKLQHPKHFAVSEEEFDIGDNVFLKNDKSKLRGREMYKVVELFQIDAEKWAMVQKSESQFRAKGYKVKTAEIFHVPGKIDVKPAVPTDEFETNADEDVEYTANEEEVESIANDGEVTSTADNEEVEVTSDNFNENKEHVGDTTTTSKKNTRTAPEDPQILDLNNSDDTSVVVSKRNRRKTAEAANKKTKKLIAEGLLKVNLQDSHEQPTHAWSYDEFRKLIEDEDDIIRKGPKLPSQPETDDYEDEIELNWDHSPEQYDLFNEDNTEQDDDANDEFRQLLEPIKLFSSPEHSDESLTSSTSDDVFQKNSQLKVRSKLQRSNAMRKQAKHVSDAPIINPGPSTSLLFNPMRQEDVILNRRQLLNQPLPVRTPIVPEAVQLGPGVLNLRLALDELNQDPNDALDEIMDEEPQEIARPRRSTRLDINYRKFNETGEK